jgi:sugar phosphate isomerase/epimerase
VKNVKLLAHGYDWNLGVRWGDINYWKVLRALRASGYDGALGVEYCGTGDPDVFVEDDAQYLLRLLSEIAEDMQTNNR